MIARAKLFPGVKRQHLFHILERAVDRISPVNPTRSIFGMAHIGPPGFYFLTAN
jgi:hypothetical protein